MEKKERGFSYFEIMLALVIIGIVVVPIGTSMISSIKTALYSENIYQATLNAETVLKEVKEQIQIDVKANKAKAYKATEVKSLQEFLNVTEADITNEKHLAKVLEDKNFNYEVAVWKVDQSASNPVKLNDTGIGSSNIALKLSTAKGNDNKPIFSTLGTEVLADFNNKLTDKLIYKDNGTELTIGADKKCQIEKALPLIELEEDYSKDKVYAYTGIVLENNKVNLKKENYGDEVVYDIEKWEGTGEKVIYIDANKLVINAGETIETSKKRSIRIKNNTPNELIIKLRDPRNKVMLLPDEKNGKIIIQRIEEINPKPNYIIAVVVREKNKNGIFSTEGKVLEKMIDIYSFRED